MLGLIRRSFELLYNRIIPLLLVLLTITGIWFLCHELERPVFDRLIRLSAEPVAKKSPVTLVLIDDHSIERLSKRFGPPPWPRAVYLKVFEKVETFQPSVMVFDSHFTPIQGRNDHGVFEAMRQFQSLITGLALSPGQAINTQLPQFFRLNLGVVNTEPDPEDGVVRRIIPYRNHRDGQWSGVFPALSLAAAYEYLNSREQTKPSPSHWQIGAQKTDTYGGSSIRLFLEESPEKGITLPLDEGGRFLVRWYSLVPESAKNYQPFRRSHQAVPLWRLFDDPTLSKDILKGRIALIGSSSAMYRDYHPTPMTLHHLGADIHATAIDNFLRGEVLTRISPWQQWTLILLLTIGVGLLRIRLKRFSHTVLYMGSFMVMYLWGAFLLMKQYRVVLDVVTPEVFMVVGLLIGSTWRVMYRDRQVENLEKAISQLVSSTVFQEIQRHGNILAPGGQRLEITSMFVDIRDFTTFAENLPPADVTALLNDFYTEVEAVIFKNNGTIDKFMGDGILIMFGAPLKIEDHALQSLRAARDVLQVADKLSEKWKDQYASFNLGISITTGIAYVGFVGPSHKLEYTGVGDTVNLCVRLQEQNKRFGVRLVISERTLEALGSHPIRQDAQPLGTVKVRGRKSELKIYTLDCWTHMTEVKETPDEKNQGLFPTAAIEAALRQALGLSEKSDKENAEIDSTMTPDETLATVEASASPSEKVSTQIQGENAKIEP